MSAKSFLILVLFSGCVSLSFAQQNKSNTQPQVLVNQKTLSTVNKIDIPTLQEQVITLQKENKSLQQQLTELQTQMKDLQNQVTANYKVMDFSFGKTQTELQTQVKALQTQVNANYKILDYSFAKLQKTAPTALVVEAGTENLTDEFKPATNYGPSPYYRSVIIDDPSCNNSPDVVVMATLQSSKFGYNSPTGIAVRYDSNLGKWKICINADLQNPTVLGQAAPYQGSSNVSVASYYPYQIFKGDKFNVVVIKNK